MLRRYRRRSREVVVDERFRGWAWQYPPIDPPYDIQLSLSEITGRYCATMRDIYLRHVEHVRKPTTPKMISGKLYHETAALAFENAKKILYSIGKMTGSELVQHMSEIRDRVIEDLLNRTKKPDVVDRGGEYAPKIWGKNMLWIWDTSTSQIAYSVDAVLSTQPYLGLDALVNTAIPVVVEQRLDGRNLGLSGHLSADAYGQEGIVMDIKTGRLQRFHRLATAGYALVIESIYEYPVDVGCIIYCWFNTAPEPQIKHDVHSIDEPLRQEFLELRDEAMKLVYDERDPGMPDQCYEDCPYWNQCH
ncbi:MAG: type I-A CRISPR-associated protein Cas4/Csa1 [Candidatus Thorarchaeota archaeon]|nr:type I-A CRISPR-associated protein Cas4/Csa1 [Candidatus Thorarchaeota archaeon]